VAAFQDFASGELGAGAGGLSAPRSVGIRWTIGDVSARGFEALRLSIQGAWNIFGPAAAYAVCVNTVSIAEARQRTGDVPAAVSWRDATGQLPDFLAETFGAGMAEGVAWKLAPLRIFPDRHELSLDNDCILWELPASIAAWLARPAGDPTCLMAEDVRACYGQFAPQCPSAPCNAGIRGLPPGFDLENALRTAIVRCRALVGPEAVFRSELDEQGLQTAALSLAAPLELVPLEQVTVCSPFHPHLPHLGRSGAHFVGLNARHIAWDYYDRPADAWMTEHWERHRPELARRTRHAHAGADAVPSPA
jgi:hypothetical protein